MKNMFDVTKGCYINSLQASLVMNHMEFGKDIYTKKYLASLDYSLELIYLYNIYNKSVKILDRQVSDVIIDIKFSRNQKDSNNNVIRNKRQLRKELYENGFVLNGVKYIRYKRTTAKSRKGHCLFIIEKLYKKMINWSRLNLHFEENEILDLPSLFAYESLPLSSIEDIIEIDPESILIIDDIESKFFKRCSVTRLNKETGLLQAKDEEIELFNNLFDGQSLVDKSIFEKAVRKDKGMMLLRKQMFKSCGFNTNIQEFFEDNNILLVKDMFGVEHLAKDIKMIITPSSLKFLKFSYKFSSKRECFEYWKKHISNVFGIVKSEHKSKYNNGKNKLAYQHINSLPLNFNDVQNLAQDEINYVKKLRNDISEFKKYCGCCEDSGLFICAALSVNDNFQYTKLFKDYRKYLVKNYINNNLRLGKIKIQKADYCTIVGNPYEMLQATIGKYNPKKCIFSDGEVYTPLFKDSEEIVGFRNPHVCSGNVLLVKNKYDWRLNKYFNFTENIVAVNLIDFPLQDTLQGSDQDSDTVLLTNNKIILNSAKKCFGKYNIPVNRVEAKKKTRKYIVEDIVDVDCTISENLIGQIINLSQFLNSLYWHNKFNGINIKMQQHIYNSISILSSMSQIEIDKAKKLYDVDMKKMLKHIYTQKFLIKDKDTQKIIRPAFFKYAGQSKSSNFKFMDTPMDYLNKLINDIPRGKHTKLIKIEDICCKSIKTRGYANTQINSIKKIFEKAQKQINGARMNCENDKESERKTKNIIRWVKAGLIEKMSNKNITLPTMRVILFNLDDFKNYKMLLLGTLFVTHKKVLLECLKNA